MIKDSRRRRVRLGNPDRLNRETMVVTLLLLGHFLVFLMSMLHDEAVAELVAEGHLAPQFSGLGEAVIGVVLFLCWSVLSIKLYGIFHAAALVGAESKGK